VLQLLPIDYDCLPCTLAVREELWECYTSVTISNIELQNEANCSYCIDSINPLFSIVISTTITITNITITNITITITTITITIIRYFTLRLFFHDLYVTPPYQRSPIDCYQLAPSKATFTLTSEAWSTTTRLLPMKPEIHCSQRSQMHYYRLASSEARDPLLSVKPDPLLPAKQDCPRGECDHSTATSFLLVKQDC